MCLHMLLLAAPGPSAAHGLTTWVVACARLQHSGEDEVGELERELLVVEYLRMMRYTFVVQDLADLLLTLPDLRGELSTGSRRAVPRRGAGVLCHGLGRRGLSSPSAAAAAAVAFQSSSWSLSIPCGRLMGGCAVELKVAHALGAVGCHNHDLIVGHLLRSQSWVSVISAALTNYG